MCQGLGPKKHDETSEIDRGRGQEGLGRHRERLPRHDLRNLLVTALVESSTIVIISSSINSSSSSSSSSSS